MIMKPKYFYIKRDSSDPRWHQFIAWLNATYKVNWGGDVNNYYGYDGSDPSQYNGTASADRCEYFKNGAVQITLQQWAKLFLPTKEFEEGEEVLVSDDEIAWTKVILLRHCSDGAVSVANGDREKYKEGKVFSTHEWKYIKKLPPKPSLPKIGDHQGRYEDGLIVYGCEKNTPEECLRICNCKYDLTFKGLIINAEHQKQIVEFCKSLNS